MAGHKKWSEIRQKAAPATLAAARKKTESMLLAMELDELRRDLGITQEQLAERLQKPQGNVSRTLRRTDMHVSTLQQVIEALGGELELVAHFPNRDVRLNQFMQSVG